MNHDRLALPNHEHKTTKIGIGQLTILDCLQTAVFCLS